MAHMRSDALPAAETQRKQNEVLAEMERALLAELDSTNSCSSSSDRPADASMP